ncbi:carboxyvinyl-carboxyphosphonate phosphorylmutase [Beggiatoa leptomitoformis]|uniref:Carboxyvinyl-carboxyphosphonate phosphorylmutase n=2 Tax=Beggiatoa leptomitoformis TaxID=288004 RepID=A0A2N9YJT5_9GAMM|nr:carboxyvinyl-carboxyphosphonate phosphorylmutase [Beggiatoa leptomitoformis]AUI70705.1 carboxyvinyl-carboxyphosphonate phosphorylmutase [Beggiatoa leptomitoformis]
MSTTPAQQLRDLLQRTPLLLMPACFDALSAKLIEQAGFPAVFMSGFGVSASRLGLPDTGLISYGEMLNQGQNICAAVKIPVLGDGDTGYGNAINVKRTVKGYAQAGFACVMLEDQVAPKRCGHTQGKQVVGREEAFTRIQAAVEARKEGQDILIMARTDARATEGLDEAIFRAQTFATLGADITFLEAPQSIEEMQAYCQQVQGYKMANMVEQGKTPYLTPAELQAIGYHLVAYPLTLLNVSILAMQQALQHLKNGQQPEQLLSFTTLKEVVGFTAYYQEEERYPQK